MKTDTQLHRDVLDELRWEPVTRSLELGVAARDGVVTLTGRVSSFSQKYSAVKAAERVAGVKAVADDIEVRLPSNLVRSDTDIAHAAADALRANIEIPAGKIKARVDEGWISLDGESEWQYQRSAAERAVRNLPGVRGVTNLIKLKPTAASPAEVEVKIKAAMRRAAEEDADRITVEAMDGRVTLRGKVRTWAERNDAERAAWSAPGVREVVDQIVIGL
jgi:osmotically-inducible protein OsmY